MIQVKTMLTRHVHGLPYPRRVAGTGHGGYGFQSQVCDPRTRGQPAAQGKCAALPHGSHDTFTVMQDL